MPKQKLTLFAAIIYILATASAQAAVHQFSTLMDGPTEDPPVPSPGTGSALVTYDDVARTLHIEASFADLVGTTTVAHIHAPTELPNQGTVGVAVTPTTLPGFPAGVTAGSYDVTLDLTDSSSYTAGFLNNFGGGTAEGAEAALIQFLLEERAYFNIHTSFRSAGEIRGFLTPIPDGGATIGLVAIGCLGLAAIRRRLTS